VLVDRSVRAGALGLAALLGAALPAPARGDPPACNAAAAGQLSQQVSVQCACRLFPESRLAGTPAGYRWDCGILRARLNQDVPVDLNPYRYPLPDLFLLDRGRRPHRR
jgi:hypothetical protein